MAQRRVGIRGPDGATSKIDRMLCQNRKSIRDLGKNDPTQRWRQGIERRRGMAEARGSMRSRGFCGSDGGRGRDGFGRSRTVMDAVRLDPGEATIREHLGVQGKQRTVISFDYGVAGYVIWTKIGGS
jgi:hypothetical protein